PRRVVERDPLDRRAGDADVPQHLIVERPQAAPRPLRLLRVPQPRPQRGHRARGPAHGRMVRSARLRLPKIPNVGGTAHIGSTLAFAGAQNATILLFTTSSYKKYLAMETHLPPGDRGTYARARCSNHTPHLSRRRRWGALHEIQMSALPCQYVSPADGRRWSIGRAVPLLRRDLFLQRDVSPGGIRAHAHRGNRARPIPAARPAPPAHQRSQGAPRLIRLAPRRRLVAP